jgi:isoquinoline 1-oxidoreductase beta subunit
MTIAQIDSGRPAGDLSRRGFLQASAAAGGGLLLGLQLPFAGSESQAASSGTFEPNAFIRMGGDGQVVLTMP